MPRERQRVRQFALALEGGTVDEMSVVPLTRLADSLHGVGAGLNLAAPSDTFKLALRNRLLAVGAVTTTPAGGLTSPAPWRRRLVAASAVLAISTGSGAGLAIASGGALPGDRLYDVKLAIENMRLALAPNDVAKAERYLAIASTRLSEIKEMLASNPNAAADPALVQELRETMSAMAEAVTAGSALFFEVFERTGDASVLATLDQFLTERSLSLSAVSDLLPVELRLSQTSLLVELEGLAARVAYMTGRTHALVGGSTSPIKDRAGRSVDRALLTDSAAAVAAAIEAMRVAAEAAQQQSAEAAAQSQPESESQRQATPESIQHDVSKYAEVNVTGQDGSVDHVSVSTMPNTEHANEFNTGSLKGSPTNSAGSASQEILWASPLPTNDVGASVPGSASASFSPTGAQTAHVAGE